MRLFSISNNLGDYDFLSNIIQIKRYGCSAKSELELALAAPASSVWSDYWPVRVNFRSLFIHEAVHFTDCTTTTWGLELSYRKFRLMGNIANKEDHSHALSVFMVNAAELHCHRELVKQGTIPLSCATSMTHTVEIHESFGPLINIHYNLNSKSFHSVPLSLLSVLEANAYSNEVLYKVISCEGLGDCEEKREYSIKVEAEFNGLLSDSSQSEYTVLINLVRIHFPYLSLKELLVYVSMLCRFTLDLSDMGCSVVSYHIERTIMNKQAGATICQDLRRASSRAVIFFKTALGIYQWINELPDSEGELIKKLLVKNPLEAIVQFWKSKSDNFETVYSFADLFMFDSSLDLVLSNSESVGVQIFSESSKFNRQQLSNTPLAMIDLQKLKLLDVFLEDETVISVPNKIGLDIKQYFDFNCDLVSATESVWDNAPAKKFFMALDEPIRFV